MNSTSRYIVLLFVTLLQLLVLSKAVAHEIRPAVIDLNFSSSTVSESNNVLQVVIVANLERLMADIGPEHTDTDNSDNTAVYLNFRAMNTDSLLNEFERFTPKLLAGIELASPNQDSIQLTVESISIPPVGDIAIPRDTTIYLTAALPQYTSALNWRWDASFGEVIVRANSDSKDLDYAALLSPGQHSGLISFDQQTQQSVWNIISNYIVVGFEHILPKGLDHILFVIGLFLLSPKWRPLAIQITVFTLAHSATLALATLGYLSISATIVEPLIALSIVFVCAENYFTSHLTRWRLATVLVFGLLHGLGFASVLGAVGLDTQNFFIALLGFNIGVEIGQLLIITLCMLGIGIWFGKHQNYRRLFSMPASFLVGSIGLFWFVQRVGIIS